MYISGRQNPLLRPRRIVLPDHHQPVRLGIRSGLSSTPYTTLNSVVLPPAPSANVTSAITVVAGVRRRTRRARPTSSIQVRMLNKDATDVPAVNLS
jgi:hypothetical protein